MTQKSQENILVVGPAWVGDMIMAQSLFMCLKQQYSDCRISVLAPDWTRPLLERMPEVEKGISLQLGHGELQLGKRRALGKSLRGERFTTSIVLPNSFKSALIPFYADIPNRVAWKGEWRNLLLSDCRHLDKEAFPLMVQRFAALAYPASNGPPDQIPEPRLQSNPESVAEALATFSLGLEHKILAICPGAEFGVAKQWPAAHFAATCEAMINKGWHVWIFGSAADTEVADEILQMLVEEQRQNCVSLAGRTSLAQAIDLLSVAEAVLSNDSGLMHIAAALNKPIVALYGSTSPDFTPPLSSKSKLLFTDIDCRPCFQRECPLEHKKCLIELEPSRAISAITELASTERT
ncbi:MAG: lipopolysaccharide heptosyltransferase II [Gammaproteobacteria bacterium]|nr:lipopolysaccharide heptosyltransferase II [Gammaproteobacteria bacterium]